MPDRVLAPNVASALLGLALVLLFPSIAGATSWPPSEPLTEDQEMELVLSSHCYIGLVTVQAVGDTLDEYGAPIDFMDVVPLLWYEGPPDQDRLRVYADPAAPGGLGLLRSWERPQAHEVIIVAFMKDGRLRLIQSPSVPLGGLAEATLEHLAYLDSAVPRCRELQSLAGLSARASTIALGVVHKAVECNRNGFVTFCAKVQVMTTLAGPVLPHDIEIVDRFVGEADTTTRLLFLREGKSGGYGLVGFHKGRSQVTNGRLPAFEDIDLPEAVAVIRRAWSNAQRRDVK